MSTANKNFESVPRLAGLLAPVFALRHKYDMGIGETPAVMRALDFCHRRKIGVFQTLPINEAGDDNSPYGAISSVALDWITLHLSPDMVPGLSPLDVASIDQSLLQRLRSGRVLYPQVRKLKHSLLQSAFERWENGQERSIADVIAYEDFLHASDDWLPQYAHFRTLMHRFGTANWMTWDAPYQNLDSATKKLSGDRKAGKECRFWSYVQWLADRQWSAVRKHARDLGILMMGDVPFGVNIFSADVWAERHLFDLKWSGGAPPEPFFASDEFTRLFGQNWGIAVYLWHMHKQDGFAWWRRRLSRAARYFDINRFDHILGVFRIYGFPWHPSRNSEFTHLQPDEIRQRTGGLVPGFLPRGDVNADDAALNATDGEEILTALCQAAAESNSSLVGEDLGCVPDYVRPILNRLGIPGFSIPQWRRAVDGSILGADTIPELTVAAHNTHDHPPSSVNYNNMVKRWTGPNGHEGWLEMRRLMSFLGQDADNPPRQFTDSVLAAHWRTLLKCPARLAIFILSDLLGTDHVFNEPGTGGDTNWSARLERELEDYECDPVFGPRLDNFTRFVTESGRA